MALNIMWLWTSLLGGLYPSHINVMSKSMCFNVFLLLLLLLLQIMMMMVMTVLLLLTVPFVTISVVGCHFVRLSFVRLIIRCETSNLSRYGWRYNFKSSTLRCNKRFGNVCHLSPCDNGPSLLSCNGRLGIHLKVFLELLML